MTDYKELIERAKEQRDRDAAEHCPAEIIALQDEVISALEQQAAEIEQLRKDIQAELDGNASLRQQYGATDRETMFAFVARVVAERDALQAIATQLREALEHHAEQTRPIQRTTEALAAADELIYFAPPGDQSMQPQAQGPENLLALADRIDHEELWRNAGMFRGRLTPEQRDRLDAGIHLRRYSHLLGSESWRIIPPKGALRYSASTLDAVVAMVRRIEDRKALRDKIHDEHRTGLDG